MTAPQPIGPLQDPLLEKVPVIGGYKVLDRVVLLERLGSGRMGIVYLGFDLDRHDAVAVKFLRPSLAQELDTVERFLRKGHLAQRVVHQNVVQVHGVDLRYGLHFLVMEFVDGETAAQRIGRRGPMSESEAVAVVHGTAAGLAEAHRLGLVHRDVNPDTVLICRSGRVKLADLGLVGLARDARGSSLTGDTPSIPGTPGFMPPEQWRTRNVRPSADVWALGATLQFLLTGAVPSSAFPHLELRGWSQHVDRLSVQQQRRDLSPRLHEVLERSTQRDPTARYPDAGALQRALAEVASIVEGQLRDAAQASATTTRMPTDEQLRRIKTSLEQPVPVPAMGVRLRARARAGGRERRNEAPVLPVVLGLVFLVSLAVLWSGSWRSPAAAAGKEEAVAQSPVPAGGPQLAAESQPERRREQPAAAPPLQPVDTEPPLLQIDLQDKAQVVVGSVLEIDAGDAVTVTIRAGAASAVPAIRSGATWQWTVPSELGNLTLRIEAADAAGNRSRPLYRTVLVVAAQSPAVATGRYHEAAGRWYMIWQAEAAARVEVRFGDGPPLEFPANADGEFEVALPEGCAPDLPLAVVAIGADGTRATASNATLGDFRPEPGLELVEPKVGIQLSGRQRVVVAVSYPFADLELRVQGASAQPSAAQDGVFEASVELPARGGLEMVLEATWPGGGKLTKRVRVGADLHESAITTGIGIVVRPVPAGDLWIGPDLSGTRLLQRIREPFWIGESEVSRGQWREAGLTLPPGPADDRLPVCGVTWEAACAFCVALTELERRDNRLPEGHVYSLPPEMWWEAACRGAHLDAPADFGIAPPMQPRRDGPEPVDSQTAVANAFGLRHMHGNVAEWVLDRLPEYRLLLNGADASVFRGAGGAHVARGGAWCDFRERTTSAFRRILPNGATTSRIGLRVALIKPDPK